MLFRGIPTKIENYIKKDGTPSKMWYVTIMKDGRDYTIKTMTSVVDKIRDRLNEPWKFDLVLNPDEIFNGRVIYSTVRISDANLDETSKSKETEAYLAQLKAAKRAEFEEQVKELEDAADLPF